MEENSLHKKKYLQWYYHPNEVIRALRFILVKPIDKNVDLTPKYGDDIEVGVVIGTYGAVPYIDLQLHWLKNINNIKHILVHDDCSDKQAELKKICDYYGADFITTPTNLPHRAGVGSLGDQSCFFRGLQWAKKNKLDVLVKLSRRFVPCYRWIDSFKKLVKESDGITFSSYCEKDLMPFRTECVGMNVSAWTNSFVLNTMNTALENEFMVHQEFWMGAMAKQLDFQNFSEKYAKYKKEHFTGELYSGYVHWYEMLGINRHSADMRHDSILWHQYSTDEEVFRMLKATFGSKYSIDDLKVVEI